MSKVYRRTKFSTLSNGEFLSIAQDKIDKLNETLAAGNILKEVFADAGHEDHSDLLVELMERLANLCKLDM